MFSMIMHMSGTITVTGRKSTLSDSGSSARPRYPGFIVMNAMHPCGCKKYSTPSYRNFPALARWPSSTALYCTEHTDSTSGTSRLNSSKQPHEPDDASPLKMSPIVR